MKKEDFKEMTYNHCVLCERIIEAKGRCRVIECIECPFHYKNMTNGDDCFQNEYAEDISMESEDEILVESCKKFIQLYKEDVACLAPAPEEKTENLKNEEEIEDIVNNPKHYRIPGTDVQVIQVIKGVLTKEEFEGSLKSNVIKYILREKEKGGLKDLEKAYKYLGWLIASKKNLELF